MFAIGCTTRPLRVAALLVGILAVGRLAWAQDPGGNIELAKRHYQAASAYFEEGKFDDAVKEFRASYDLSHKIELLFNISQCYMRKGDSARAVVAYQDYLVARPDAPDRRAVEATIEQLRKNCGRLKVTGASPGTEILIDDQTVGRVPLAAPLLVTAGVRRIAARSADGTMRTLRVGVSPDEEVIAAFDPLVAPVERPIPGVGPGKATVPRDKEPEHDKESTDLFSVDLRQSPAPMTPVEPWYKSKAGWGVSIAGLLVAGAGGAFIGLTSSEVSKATSSTTDAEWQTHRNRATTYQTLGIAMLSVGGAALIGGIVVFAVKGRDKPARKAWLAPTGDGIVVGGAW